MKKRIRVTYEIEKEDEIFFVPHFDKTISVLFGSSDLSICMSKEKFEKLGRDINADIKERSNG